MLGDFSALADYPARPRNTDGAMSGTTTAALTSGFTVGNLAVDAPGKLKKQTNREAIMALQVRLRDAGSDPGPVDGIFGPRTKSALLGYEASVR